MNKIPTNWHLCDGTNGTPDLQGRFLEGVTDGVGQFHSAGLPNITGEFGNCEEDGSPGDNGPFSRYSTYIGAASDLSIEIVKRSIFYYELDGAPESGYTLKRIPAFNVSPHGAMGYNWRFNASRSSRIYGNSSTVQPNSYTVYYIMRIK